MPGHRVIEIGCVELVNRRFTGRSFHQYLNPEKSIDSQAIKVHGLTQAFLADKPRFSEVCQDFVDFVTGAELIIHNAPFDCGFLEQELRHVGSTVTTLAEICQITDTLQMAREKFRGKRNSLDALCERFGIDNSHRVHHGALLDAEILADVYLMLTGGQTHFDFAPTQVHRAARNQRAEETCNHSGPPLKVVYANTTEQQAHASV